MAAFGSINPAKRQRTRPSTSVVSEDVFSSLPNELIEEILKMTLAYPNASTLGRYRIVRHRWNRLVNKIVKRIDLILSTRCRLPRRSLRNLKTINVTVRSNDGWHENDAFTFGKKAEAALQHTLTSCTCIENAHVRTKASPDAFNVIGMMLSNLTSLKSLKFYRSEHCAALLVEHFNLLSNLTQLSTNLRIDHLDHICNLTQLSNLFLDLRVSQTTVQLDNLRKLQNLKVLGLCSWYDDVDLSQLVLPCLENLSICGNFAYSQITHMTTLRLLYLNHYHLDLSTCGEGFYDKFLSNFPNLVGLHIADPDIGFGDVIAVQSGEFAVPFTIPTEELSLMTSLTGLHIWTTRNEEGEMLVDLGHLSSLEISGLSVGSWGSLNYKNISKLCDSLTYLSIEGPLKYMTEQAVLLTNLVSLGLEETNIEPDALALIAKKNTRLNRLSISNTCISDEMVDTLTSFEQIQEITLVCDKQTQPSTQCAERFKTQCPHVLLRLDYYEPHPEDTQEDYDMS